MCAVPSPAMPAMSSVKRSRQSRAAEHFIVERVNLPISLVHIRADAKTLLHDTSLPPSKDRGHLALVEGGTPSVPDAAATPEKAYAK